MAFSLPAMNTNLGALVASQFPHCRHKGQHPAPPRSSEPQLCREVTAYRLPRLYHTRGGGRMFVTWFQSQNNRRVCLVAPNYLGALHCGIDYRHYLHSCRKILGTFSRYAFATDCSTDTSSCFNCEFAGQYVRVFDGKYPPVVLFPK